MRRFGKSLFLSGNNCFNKETLEIFSLEDDYIKVIDLLSNDREVPDRYKQIAEEIRESGILDSRASERNRISIFEPDFVSFRLVLGKLCNLRCRNCFVLEPGFDPVLMSKDNLRAILEKTFSYGEERNLKYHFFGGEPLMMFDLIREAVVQIEEAVLRGRIKRPIYTVTTNGTLLDDYIASFFKRYDFKVGISIDGPREMNDHIRGRGVFDKVSDAFRLLEKYGVERWFLITPYEDIIDKVPDFVEWLSGEFDFKSITFNTPFDREALRWSVDGTKLADMILECHKRFRGRDIVIESAAAPIFYALSSGEKRIYPCSIAKNEIMGSISPDGRISTCAQYWSEDLFGQSFLQDFSYAFRLKEQEECLGCIAENICGGPCMVNYAKTGEIDRNKCRFYRRLIDRFLASPEEYMAEDQIFAEEA